MSQNEPNKGGGGPQGGGGNQPKGGGGPRGKSPFDSTNILGAAIWLGDGLLTAIAIGQIAISIPTQCVGDRGQLIPDCFVPLASNFWGVFLFALIIQVIITVVLRRVHVPAAQRTALFLEVLINMIGFVWLICTQLGLAGGVYRQIQAFFGNMTIDTLLWWVLIISLSYGTHWLVDHLFNAPPAGRSGPQRR